jgi:CheY-like chemotaxis protein
MLVPERIATYFSMPCSFGAGKKEDYLEDTLPSGQTSVHKGEPKKIGLLVEDNNADVLLIQDAIEHYGLSVELYVVDDGDKAFRFIEHAETVPGAPCPDFLLVDLNLPKRSGKEVLQRVRQSAKCGHIPVLILSSSDLSRDRADLSALGASGYFRKVSDYDEFLKVGAILKLVLEGPGHP